MDSHKSRIQNLERLLSIALIIILPMLALVAFNAPVVDETYNPGFVPGIGGHDAFVNMTLTPSPPF